MLAETQVIDVEVKLKSEHSLSKTGVTLVGNLLCTSHISESQNWDFSKRQSWRIHVETKISDTSETYPRDRTQ